jgi:hypothetical protein
MRRFIILTFLLILVASSFGQRHFKYFYGTVTDRVTSTPLPGVNITFTGTRNGCVTDSKGAFSVFLDTIPVYMTLTHLGYETRKIWLDGTSASLTVFLNPAATMLREIEIVAKTGPESFFRDRQYSVLDFEVRDSLVFVLIYRFTYSESELLCMDLTGKRVASSGRLGIRPDSLFRDCLGNIHILDHDSAYQVFCDSSTIRLIYATPLGKFSKLLKDCTASTESTLFYKQVVNNGMGIDFYTVDRLHGKRQLIASETDEKKMNMLRRNRDDYGRISSSEIPDDNESFREWSFAKKILYKPITASLHRIDDYVCIFNTAEMTIEFYTLTGEFSSKMMLGVNEVKEGKWTKDIYVDEETRKVYTTFARNGRCFLYSVNLNTGELTRVMTMAHEFPEKVTVHGGNLLYMYSLHGKGENKELFRQRVR